MSDITYSDCIRYVVSLFPQTNDPRREKMFKMVLQALKEAERRKEGKTRMRLIDADAASKLVCERCNYTQRSDTEMSEIRAEHIPGTDEMKIYVNGVFVRCCNFWEVGETMEELAQREREKEKMNES